MLENKILNDYKEALKKRQQDVSSTLNFLRAALKNEAIKLKKDELDDNEAIVIIKRLIKQHQDSIEQFKKGQRQELVEKEERELEILKSYLPKQLDEEQLKSIVDEAADALQATSMKDMGKVMKEVMAKVASSADGKMVSDMVKKKLTPSTKQEEK